MPPGSPTPLSNRAPASHPAPWRVIGRLHGHRQLADKEGRLCCRNRGRAWRSRSAAAHRRSGTAPRLAARRLGALAVSPSRPAAGVRPLRWPRSPASPARRAWPWPPLPRGPRDVAVPAGTGGRRRFRSRNAAVRVLPVARHRGAAGRPAAGRPAADRPTGSVTAAREVSGHPTSEPRLAAARDHPDADASRTRRYKAAAAAERRTARRSGWRKRASGGQASIAPAHHPRLDAPRTG
jgi:hypothetical protein